MSTPKPFGWRAKRKNDGWHVFLPHQCDEWTIAGGPWSGDAVNQAEAVAEMERFIAEAQAALAALAAGKQYPQ